MSDAALASLDLDFGSAHSASSLNIKEEYLGRVTTPLPFDEVRSGMAGGSVLMEGEGCVDER